MKKRMEAIKACDIILKSKKRKISPEEIEEKLGLNKIIPIKLSPNDLDDRVGKEDYFDDWYNEELENLFND